MIKLNFHRLYAQAQHTVSDNAPVILTAVGVAGTLATAYLTGRATAEAVRLLDSDTAAARESTGDPTYEFNPKTKAKIVWHLYIPPISVAAVTCGAIICANRVEAKRTAALAAALAITERAYDEYKEKALDVVGTAKEQKIRDEVAKDRVKRDEHQNGPIVMPSNNGKVLVHDAYSGRFFESTVNEIDKAVNEINQDLRNEGNATVSDFYDKIKLSHTSASDQFGWRIEEPLVIKWTTCTTDDGQYAAHSYDFATFPVYRPWRNDSFR